MKATIDLPDDLYRRVKAKSALQGRAIREVTMDLYQRWLEVEIAAEQPQSPEDWVEAWLQLGNESLQDAPPGPTATEILRSDRSRLEVI